jgi:nucleoid DNA-binding protein
MSILEEFINEYVSKNNDKKISKADLKNICNSFVDYISSTIEKTVQENKAQKKEVSIISLRNLGKFSIAHRAGRDINLSNKTIKVPSYWVLKFKSSSVIKNKLKSITQ